MVKIRQLSAVIALALTATSCTVDGASIIVREERTFPVSGEPDVTIGTFDGAIRVRSWARDEVRVSIEKRGANQQEAESLEVATTQDGNQIRVEARSPRLQRESIHIGRFGSPSVSLTVMVPRRLALRAETGDGSIAVEQVTGKIALRSGDGSIRGENIEGDLNAKTGDGSVRIASARGRAVIDTGDGNVNIQGRLEGLLLSTGDGSVVVDAEDGSVMAEDWNITTGDGSIAFQVPPGFNAEIDAGSRDGSVRAEGVSLTTTSERGDREALQGRLGTGGHSVRIRSGDGSVRIVSR